KQILGVIDLSTTWQKHNSFALLAAERCATIIQSALLECQKQRLFIGAFSVPQILFNGKMLVLTPRQIEILTILALCPQGLSLDTAHPGLYAAHRVSMGTLKEEKAKERAVLGSVLGSRP